MSLWYDFYLEVFVDGKWECACPRYTLKDGEEAIHEIVSGKSSLQDVYDDYCGCRVEVCAELEARFKPQKESDLIWYNPFRLFNIDAAEKFVFAYREENQGYVERSKVMMFKSAEGDLFGDHYIDEYLSIEEFRALNPEEQKAYVYYEWTNNREKLDMLRRIFAIADRFKEMYKSASEKKPTEYRIVAHCG